MVNERLEKGHDVTIATRGKVADEYGDRVERIIIERTNEESLKNTLRGKYYDVVIDEVESAKEGEKMKQKILLLVKIVYGVFLCSIFGMAVIVFQEENNVPALLFVIVGSLLILSGALSLVNTIILFYLEIQIEWREQGIKCIEKLFIEIVVMFVFLLVYSYIGKERWEFGKYSIMALSYVVGSRGIGSYLLGRKKTKQ